MYILFMYKTHITHTHTPQYLPSSSPRVLYPQTWLQTSPNVDDSQISIYSPEQTFTLYRDTKLTDISTRLYQEHLTLKWVHFNLSCFPMVNFFSVYHHQPFSLPIPLPHQILKTISSSFIYSASLTSVMSIPSFLLPCHCLH